MLVDDPGRMRWMGVALWSRRRRRWAVVVSYAVFFPLVLVATLPLWPAHRYVQFCGGGVSLVVWGFFSVFGWLGPVKAFEENRVVRIGAEEVVAVAGLDEWARYRFGVKFDALTAEQQSELLDCFRAGVRYLPKSGDARLPMLDEREERERANVERWALRTLAQALVIVVAWCGWSVLRDGAEVSGPYMLTVLMWMATLAYTLPKARVLWIEPDPREAGAGELSVLRGQEV